MIGSRISFRIVLSVIALSSTLTSSTASADPLKLMTEFNIITLGDANLNNVNVGGRVAVGGDAKLTNFSIGTGNGGNSGVALSADGTRLDLIVDGKATLTQGSFQKGSALAGTGTQTGVGYNTPGAGLTFAPSPIDFDDIGAQAVDESRDLRHTTANGTQRNQYSTLTMWGSDAAMNVFTLTAADVQNISSLQLLVPATSRVLINVIGGSFSLSNLGMSINGSQGSSLASQVLWNFANAQSLTVSSVNWLGSILAPFAALNFSNAQMNGSVFVNSLVGQGGFNNVPLSAAFSDAPATVPVPEPATLTFFALGGGLIGVARLIRRRVS